MITETEAYKGRKFTCDNCNYVVSSNAMSVAIVLIVGQFRRK